MQRLHPRRSAESRERIVNGYPLYSIAEVDIGLRSPVELSFQIGQHDVDDVRVMTRFTEERAPALATKRTFAVIG